MCIETRGRHELHGKAHDNRDVRWRVGLRTGAATSGTPRASRSGASSGCVHAQICRQSAALGDDARHVQTRIGTLNFKDGLPDADTIKKVYDNLDFARGVEAFLLGMPAASVQAMRRGFIEGGFPPNEGFGISESLADARSLFLTPNTVVVYTWGIIDVKDGPMVLQVPPGVLGILDDAHFRFVTDLGVTDPTRARAANTWWCRRATPARFRRRARAISSRNPAPTATSSFCAPSSRAATLPTIVKNVKANAAMYPLSAAAKPPPTKFVNFSGMQINTVHANDFTFYEELNEVVQHEPDDFLESEVVGILASIGIKKGKPFAPGCAHEGDPHRRGGGRQRHVARDDIRLARPADQGTGPTGSGPPPSRT